MELTLLTNYIDMQVRELQIIKLELPNVAFTNALTSNHSSQLMQVVSQIIFYLTAQYSNSLLVNVNRDASMQSVHRKINYTIKPKHYLSISGA